MSTLVIFSGLPGTGKSTLANRLARELRWPLIRIDDVVVEVPEQAGFAFWDTQITIVLSLAQAQLELGLDVIVDSVFMNTDRYHAEAIALEQDAVFRPVHTYMSDEKLWEQRVTRRAVELNNPAVSTWELIQHQRRHFRPWQPGTALLVDGVLPPEQNYAEVLQYVTRRDISLQPLEPVDWVRGRYHS